VATAENLKEAFAGESQANRKYMAFAKKADAEGYPQIARLFRATAEAETVHANAHLRALNGVRGTLENLETAIAGEHYEFTEMYPKFLEIARDEGHQAAQTAFEYALAVEKVHHGLYEKALETLRQGKDLDVRPVYVCPVCGHTVIGEAPDKCPICGVPKNKFAEIK